MDRQYHFNTQKDKPSFIEKSKAPDEGKPLEKKAVKKKPPRERKNLANASAEKLTKPTKKLTISLNGDKLLIKFKNGQEKELTVQKPPNVKIEIQKDSNNVKIESNYANCRYTEFTFFNKKGELIQSPNSIYAISVEGSSLIIKEDIPKYMDSEIKYFKKRYGIILGYSMQDEDKNVDNLVKNIAKIDNAFKIIQTRRILKNIKNIYFSVYKENMLTSHGKDYLISFECYNKSPEEIANYLQETILEAQCHLLATDIAKAYTVDISLIDYRNDWAAVMLNLKTLKEKLKEFGKGAVFERLAKVNQYQYLDHKGPRPLSKEFIDNHYIFVSDQGVTIKSKGKLA